MSDEEGNPKGRESKGSTKSVFGTVAAVVAFLGSLAALLIAIPRGIEAWQKPNVPVIFAGVVLIALASASIWVLWNRDSFSKQAPRHAKQILSVVVLFLLVGIVWGVIRYGVLPTTNLSGLGSKVNIDRWRVFADQHGQRDAVPTTVGDYTLAGKTAEMIQAAGIVLQSQRDAQGWTKPEQSVVFAWQYPIQDNVPYNGMIVQLFIEPVPRSDNQVLFCRFIADYRLENTDGEYVYVGSEHLVSLSQWNTLVWDFTGTIWTQGQPWEDEWADLRDEQLESAGHLYAFINRRLGEQALEYAAGVRDQGWHQTWMERFESFGIQCFVSASEHYTGAQNPTFRGDFYLSNIWVQPVDSMRLP